MEPNVLPFFLIGNNALSHVFSLSWCKLQMKKKNKGIFQYYTQCQHGHAEKHELWPSHHHLMIAGPPQATQTQWPI